MPDDEHKNWTESASFLIIRIGVGGFFIVHGLAQLIDSSGSIAGVTLLRTGIDPSPEMSRLIVFLELGGGLGVAIGLFTRVFAAALTIEAAWSSIVWWLADRTIAPSEEYWAFPLMLAVAMLSVALHGGGPWSLDRLLQTK